MRKRFSILSIVALAGIASILPMQAMRGDSDSQPQRVSKESALVPTSGKASGEVLLDSAIIQLESQASIRAQLRLWVHLLDHYLSDGGSYLQEGRGEDRKFYFQLSAQGSAGHRGLTQVNDGELLWILEENADARQLQRVDLQQLRESGVLDENEISMPGLDEIGMGGLAGMMRSIQKSFRFDQAVQIESGAGRRVWAMRGPWRQEQLAKLVATGKKSPSKMAKLVSRLPEWAPTDIGILLDVETLFPYKIEFLRASQAEDSGKPVFTLIATLEFFEVQFNVDIPRNSFNKPSSIDWVDVTKKMLRRTAAE